MRLTNAHFTTISGHFSTNCMFIFHKTEVQTVILRCLMGLNLELFKIYGLWCTGRPRTCLANFQKIAIDKWSFYYHIWPFFASCVLIFHKTEVQTVILGYLMGLNLDWFKIYGLWYTWRPRTCLANFQKVVIDKWRFYYHILHCLPAVCWSLTKLRSRRSFWGT